MSETREFVGSYIDPEVNKQLQARANIFGKTSGRTESDLFYLSSRTSWVRVISSVNTGVQQVTLTSPTDPSKTVTGRFDNGTPDLAKKYILSGPVTYVGNDTLSLKSGIDFTGNSNKLYNYDPSTGVRPAPGITDFKVTSKNRFGTIREANINFAVWTKTEIDIIEQLYFRPGYSAVVEWGHSIYVDNDGNIETSPAFNVGVDEYFTEIPFSKIVEKTTLNKKTHFGNYDAFIGYIKNFSWSFRQDGGYDCSISIISFGEILESLTVKTAPAVIKGSTVGGDTKDEIKSVIHLLFSELRALGVKNSYVRFRNLLDSFLIKQILKQEIQDLQENSIIAYEVGSWEKEKRFFIPLKIFLGLLNSLTIKYGECSKQEYVVSFGTEITESGKYVTFSDHFSLDPGICLLPKKPVNIPSASLGQPHPTLNQAQTLYTEPITGEECLNILVSQRCLEDTLDAYLKSNGDSYEFSILEYVRDILGQVNNALGNINEIDIEYDEELTKYKLVDRKRNVPENTDNTATQPAPLTLTGVSSLFSNLTIQSKVSNKLGTMISIAAQGTAPNKDSKSLEDTALWTEYNKGLGDRYTPDKVLNSRECYQIPVEEKKVTFTTTFLNWFSRIYPVAYLALVGLWSYSRKQEVATFIAIAEEAYKKLIQFQKKDEALFEKVKSLGPPFFAEILQISQQNDPKGTIKGLFPVELSFTLDGIGGLKIGQSFTVTGDILPSKFNNYGYIITGLDHSIDNGKWMTQVKAQTYLLPGEKQSGTSTTVSSPTSQTTSTETSFQPDNTIQCYDKAKKAAEDYLGRSIADNEWKMLIATVKAEAGLFSTKEKVWVAACILNRVRNRAAYGNSIIQAITAPYQFQAVTGVKGDPLPSPSFVQGPSRKEQQEIYCGMATYLTTQQIPTTYEYFVSNLDSAYKGGTNINAKYCLLCEKSAKIIGQSIFSATWPKKQCIDTKPRYSNSNRPC
jgi:hypothetical protein